MTGQVVKTAKKIYYLAGRYNMKFFIFAPMKNFYKIAIQ